MATSISTTDDYLITNCSLGTTSDKNNTWIRFYSTHSTTD